LAFSKIALGGLGASYLTPRKVPVKRTKEIPDIDSVIYYARKKLMLQTLELGE
jgi:hypothetical protein